VHKAQKNVHLSFEGISLRCTCLLFGLRGCDERAKSLVFMGRSECKVHFCAGAETVLVIQPTVGVVIYLYNIITMALEGGEGSAPRPGRSLTPGRTLYPLYRKLGGPQGRPGQVRKISLPPGFDPRTVQPVASRYTD
jgi:hypothetical protein